ncbi:MAG: hypothetical protein JWO84_619 [Parcubacteria group bacterium]|nr:hypothetical protein [Parcubacteria group bacterium]
MPIVLILLALGIFVGYINPTYTGKILPLQAQIKQYNSTLAAANDFNKKEAELATARNAIPADAISHLQAYLPDGVDNVQLILDLNALAAKSGVLLSNFDIKSSASTNSGVDQSAGALPLDPSAKPTDAIDVSVAATATYGAFRTFLDGVERSLRPMDVVQMTLNDSTTGVYTYNLTFRIYWLH